jgi:hypothetical protein
LKTNKRHKLLIVGLLLLVSVLARAASFTASLDRDAIALGETATLSLKFEGGAPDQLPSSLTVSNLQLTLVGGPTHFELNINGNATSYDTFNYVVTPTQAGEFTIPSLTANVGGRQMNSQPLKLTVNKPGTAVAAGNPDSQFAFARLSLPKREVYNGETIVADLQLFYRQGTQLARQPQIVNTSADGFTVGKVIGENQTLAQVGNAVYNVIPAKIALTADKTGTVHVGPVTVNLALLIPTQNGGDDQFMDPFGMFTRRAQKDFSITTETLDAQAKPLPEENKPADFTGAIGDFTLAASAGPTNLTVGDPITVRVQIAGSGNLDSIQLPDQSALNNFKIFPPTSKTETSDQLGLEGTRTFEEIVTPQNADVREWPQFSISFFNPEDGKYHVLTQAAVPLTVKAAGAPPLPQAAATKAEEKPPQDILPLKNDLGALAKNSAPLVSQPAFLAAQTLPVLAFLAAFVWRKRTDNLANNPRLRRQRAVAALVASGKDEMKKYAAANQPDEFFATLFRLLQEQLGERLDCPATAITEAIVTDHALLRTAPLALRTALHEQFQLCNQARYAPVRGSGELNSVAKQFEKLLGELQNLKA